MSELDGQTEPIGVAELQSYQDADWALHDPAVQQQYEGQWVVAYQGRIIAHGHDPQSVLHEAAQLAKDQSHRVVFCARDDAKTWLEGTSAADVELANG